MASKGKPTRLFGQAWSQRTLFHNLQKIWVNWNNEQRKKETDLDYVLMNLPQVMPPLPEPRGLLQRRFFGDPPLSQWELSKRLERIAKDSRTKGVILHLRGFAMSLADLQSLRDIILRFRAKGKRVICYAQNYDLATYYVAVAADEVIIQPGGNVFTVGLRQEAVFLKDALAEIGVEFDSIAISPYKGAVDALTRSEISDEGREQLEWLLDSRYNQIVRGIAEGRKLDEEKVREVIDSAPYLDKFAKGVGLIDAVRYEEELLTYLHTEHILSWEQADEKLLLQLRSPSEKYIAVLKIEGMMIPGESVNPPDSPVPVPVVDDGRVGDITIVQQVRALMQDENVAAVVLFVDSGGGAAIAAEAMYAALNELAQKVPMVVYMNGVAASGGYLVSMTARHIVAQSGTITGSIGVLLSKPIVGDLRNKLRLHAFEFMRGKNADILSTTKPFSDSQRAWLRESIERTYEVFINHVALGREMHPDDVDKVGGGRVWTGEQALEHGLVDTLGGLHEALAKACEFANLPEDAPVALVTGKSKPLGPQVARQANPAAYINFVQDGVQQVANGQPQLLMPFVLK